MLFPNSSVNNTEWMDMLLMGNARNPMQINQKVEWSSIYQDGMNW